jgi:Flp pilus assembly protein TadD
MEASEPRSVELEKLQHDVRWALRNRLGPRDLVPMLERLIRCAPEASPDQHGAMLQLAEVLAAEAPWRAALLCRRVLDAREMDRALGVLGLCLTMLGYHRAAARAYRRALALRPDGIEYAHNLGHLLDVAFNKPGDGLPLLASAHRSDPLDPEIAGSYAHALARTGKRREAERVLRRALGSAEAACALLDRWVQ